MCSHAEASRPPDRCSPCAHRRSHLPIIYIMSTNDKGVSPRPSALPPCRSPSPIRRRVREGETVHRLCGSAPHLSSFCSARLADERVSVVLAGHGRATAAGRQDERCDHRREHDCTDDAHGDDDVCHVIHLLKRVVERAIACLGSRIPNAGKHLVADLPVLRRRQAI